MAKTKTPDEIRADINDFSKLLSSFVKNISLAGDALDLTNDKTASFVKTIQESKIDPDEIANTVMSQLQAQLEAAGKNITIPNLIKQLEGQKVDVNIINSMKEWAKARNQYVLGVKSLAEELGVQLVKPFEAMTDWIKKIPGGKLLHKIFGFDDIKKDIQKNITEKLAASIKGNKMSLKSLKEVGVGAFKSMGKAAQVAFAHPVLLAIVLIVGALYLVYKQWMKTVEAAKQLRDETGLIGRQAMDIAKISSDVAEQYMEMGVSMEIAGKSAAALVNEFQSIDVITKGMYANSALLVGVLGVTEQAAAKIVQQFKVMGNLTDDESKKLIALTSEAAKLGGVAPAKVFEDMAASSKEINKYFKGNYREALKTSIELRRMGTTLKEAAASAESMLDFETSITSELEASVLLGRQLDFSAARYHAFMGDIEAQQREVLRQVGDIDKFNKMLPFQKEAVAKASGMELEQLTKMLTTQKLLSKLTYEKQREYKEGIEALKEMKELDADSMLQANTRLLAQEKMSAIWDKVVFMFSKILFPLFDAAYDTIDEIARQIGDMFDDPKMQKSMAEIKEAMMEVGQAMIEIVPPLVRLFVITLPTVIRSMLNTMKPLISIIKFVGHLLTGEWGAALTDLRDIATDTFKMMTNAILLPFKLIGAAFDDLFGTKLVEGFEQLGDWIGNFLGELVNLMMSPFNLVFAAITGGFQGVKDYLMSWWDDIYKNVIEPFADVASFFGGLFTGESYIPESVKQQGQVPGLAAGGVVTRPQIGMMGEAGPEAIIPLNKMEDFGKSKEIVSQLKTLIEKSDPTIITKKLDELVEAIQSMTIVMDHRKVGEVLASNTSHPGFGG